MVFFVLDPSDSTILLSPLLWDSLSSKGKDSMEMSNLGSSLKVWPWVSASTLINLLP